MFLLSNFATVVINTRYICFSINIPSFINNKADICIKEKFELYLVSFSSLPFPKMLKTSIFQTFNK